MRSLGGRAIKAKVAAAVGFAAVLGMASLAVASPDSPPSTEPTVEPTSGQQTAAPTDATTGLTDGPDAEGDESAATDPTIPDSTDTAAPPAAASEFCSTHGQRVSAIAHTTPPGPGHGAAVSAVAHDHTGECADDEEETGEPADDTDDDQIAPPAVSSTPPETPESDDTEHDGTGGNGGSGVQGHGNGHGPEKG